MTSDRFGRVERILEEALDHPEQERKAFIAESCGGDARLAEEVGALLDEHVRMGGFLETSAVERFKGALYPEGELVGGYRIERVLGSGSGGTVYLAEQENPRRNVALKAMHGGFSTDTAAARFEREADILARLQHPAIAHVYEAGVHDGTPFIVLEYVENAATLLEFAGPRSRRERLELFADVCSTVHEGHREGVIHRDLKPANVLVLPSGHPKVIDFGIARVEGISVSGEIAGTPPYMSPEQYDEVEIDERSDVYSLGVLLYQLLTGRLPHDVSGLSMAEARRQVQQESPAPPKLPFELKSIVLRALATAPDERYPTALALAEDVRRFLARRPVRAVGHGVLYRGLKFISRHRVATASLAVLATVAAATAIRGATLASPTEDSARIAEMREYATQIRLARDLIVQDPELAREYLNRIDERHRDREWHELVGELDTSKRRLEWPGVQLATGAVSRDGRLAAAIGSLEPGAHQARIWDTDSGRVVCTIELGGSWAYSVAFDPAAERLAVGFMDGLVGIWSTTGGDLVRRFQAHDGNVTSMLFHPEGAWLATASKDHTVRLWSPQTGGPLRTLTGHRDRVICLALHGERLATGARDGMVRIWDLSTDDPPHACNVFSGISVEGIAWRPDGSGLAAVARDGRACIWSIREQPARTTRQHENVARAVDYSPDGSSVAVASWDGTISILSSTRRTLIRRLLGHEGMVMSVWFRGDDELISFGTDGTVRFWDPRPR